MLPGPGGLFSFPDWGSLQQSFLQRNFPLLYLSLKLSCLNYDNSCNEIFSLEIYEKHMNFSNIGFFFYILLIHLHFSPDLKYQKGKEPGGNTKSDKKIPSQ